MTSETPFAELRRRLLRSGVAVGPPATAAALDAFEGAAGFPLPAEVRAFFGTVGGTGDWGAAGLDGGEPDHLMFHDLSGAEPEVPPPGAGRRGLSVANYLVFSFTYVARWTDGDAAAEVWASAGPDYQARVADTLTAFVVRVLRDGDAVNLAAMNAWEPSAGPAA